MELTQLKVASWNRFVPRNLFIHPDLVGAVHKFRFEENEITIQLPSSKHLPTDPIQEGPLSFDGWREQNGIKMPIEYSVNEVDIEISIAEEIALPCKILDVPPCAIEIITSTQQEHLNHLANVYGSITERAFDLWIRTLRWKCNNSAIGRPEISGCETGWTTRLVAKPQNKHVWIASSGFRPKGSPMVTPKNWTDVEISLKQGCNPPLYIDLIMDASEHIELNDFSRAIVDTAIACETFLRMIVGRSLPPSLRTSVATYIDDANIRQVIRKFVPEILNNAERREFDKIKNKLHALFDTRNNIVHKGQVSNLTNELCEGFLEMAKKLFGKLSDHITKNQK
jgi:hypothetical protein